MKIWIKTKLNDKADANKSNPNRPRLNGHEENSNISTAMTKPLSSGHILIRVEGMPKDIISLQENAIAGLDGMILLTDDEAEELIRTKLVKDVSQLKIQRGHAINPIKMFDRENWTCENCDCCDREVDTIAIAHGLYPKIRADIVIPTRGKHLLQDQENYLMSHISEKIGLTKDYWDTEAAKTTKWKKGVDIEHDIKDGKGEAHEFTLSRIRMKHLKITCSCDKPNKVAHDITCIEVPDIPIKDRKELPIETAQAQGYAPCPVCKPFVV